MSQSSRLFPRDEARPSNHPTQNAVVEENPLECRDVRSTCRFRFQRPVELQLGRASWLLWLILSASATIFAHDQIPGAPQAAPVIITGATIYPIDQPPIENGSVLFDEGKITAVGTDIGIPDGALEIDGRGKHVYPGLIESVTDIGLTEISAVDATRDRVEFGDRNPNVRSWVAVNPDSELIPVGRAGGVLTAMTAPLGAWMRGQTAVLYLDGWTVAEMTVLAPAGIYVNWSALHPRGGDDNEAEEREQQLADFDALLDEARRYGEARSADAETTPTDVRLESLLPVIAGDMPLIAQANRKGEIESAIQYAQAQNLRLIIHGGYDAAQCAELLNEYTIPVIIDSIYRLPLRRDDPYDSAFTLPQRLKQAGVRFAIAGETRGASNLRNLPYHAAAAVAHGLHSDDALRAITLSPAEILGVADRIGSLTVGKDATLIITDGDMLETETHVTAAYIAGRKVDLGNRHKMLYEKYQQKYSSR